MIFLVLPVIAVHAQGITGLADIRVLDTDGNPVDAAIVSISNPAKGVSRQKRTNSNGRMWARLVPAEYVLEVAKAGYESARIEQVSIRVGVTTPLVVPLRPDSLEEVIVYASPESLMHIATGETGLNISLSANLLSQSGRPRNAFGTQHPNGLILYGNTFYLVQPDGSFESSPRGSYGRTDWTTEVNLSAIYSFDWGDWANVELRADVFNLFDADNPTEVGEFLESAPREFGIAKQYQRPRYLRLGVAMRF
jgi:hypothetical protein